ncbi:TrbC family F-type conjugative pilus assembly protein [Sulfurimonas sp.]|uniref:TrbC family F-type conjugative pilus assembly protein n=1 Tax=Sulfurimonas sp. TaxID=2022749 RepID=UPI0025F9B13A|nr:TrbC family F-type conjugative pilus assembly protein [Sulfurimonas sp.]
MRNIFIALLFICYTLSGEVLEVKTLLQMLKHSDKQSYAKALEIQELAKTSINSNGDIVYCLVSESIEIKYLKKIIFEMTALGVNTDTKVAFITQGVYSKKFIDKIAKLTEEFNEYESGEYFKANVNIFIAPSLFTEYKIMKVPALLYGKYKGSIYPQNKRILYIARGNISPLDFFKLISTKESRFETYSNIISTLY